MGVFATTLTSDITTVHLLVLGAVGSFFFEFGHRMTTGGTLGKQLLACGCARRRRPLNTYSAGAKQLSECALRHGQHACFTQNLNSQRSRCAVGGGTRQQHLLVNGTPRTSFWSRREPSGTQLSWCQSLSYITCILNAGRAFLATCYSPQVTKGHNLVCIKGVKTVTCVAASLGPNKRRLSLLLARKVT